jgi:RNA polymerase sigma-70 factor (sigma-E family)
VCRRRRRWWLLAEKGFVIHHRPGPETIEAEFSAFVAARWSQMLRFATLLTGDAAAAEDLLQTAMAKLWFAWRRARDGSPEAYLRRILVTTQVSGARRRWHGERASTSFPETMSVDTTASVVDREMLRHALMALTPRQRAVIVLRYFEDMSERDTADALGCSIGTVKTLASRALVRLRAVPGLRAEEPETMEAT